MDLNLPDPITSYNRQHARRRYQRREAFILGHHPGFNLVYWQRIIRVPARIDRWGERRGWSAEQILLTKAMLISRMACIFIDHIIQRMEQVDIISHAPGAPDQEWEKQYRNFILLFSKVKSIPERLEIVKQMQRLHYYTLPPDSLIVFRQRHWRCIQKVLHPLLTPSGAQNLFIRRQFLAKGNPVAAARRICFTAALYSDIQEHLYHQKWMFAYSDCMLRLYAQIRKTPLVLAAIIDLT